MSDDRTILGLATRRRKSAISLEQISEATKIGMRSLQAIEAGEFEKLPGGIYSTSYIRQYAQAIGADEAQILALYYAATGTGPELPETPKRAPEAERNFVSRLLRHSSAII